MSEPLKYPKGTPLIITEGCYSDFSIVAALVTIKDCDLAVLAQQFVAENAGGNYWDREPDRFPAWLVANSWAMPAEFQTCHLGDYDWDDDFGIKTE